MPQTIYQDIGGKDAVEAVVTDFYDQILADEQLTPYFDGMDMNELRAHQIQLISAVTGGPVEYTGDDMREAHAHLDIDEEDFNVVSEYLESALQANGVDDDNVAEIMAEVMALKKPVLNR